MASGNFNLNKSSAIGSSATYIEGRIEWSSTTDKSNNKSSVKAVIYVRKKANITLTVATTGTWNYSISINSSKSTGSLQASVLESWVKIGEYTVSNIVHNNDGTKSVSISGSVSAPSGTSIAGLTTSGSGTAVMETVPRAADIYSVSNGRLGYKPTIKWYPKASNHKYDLKFVVGGYDTGYSAGYITPNTTNLYSYAGLEIPDSAAKQFTDAQSMTATAYLRTFDSSGKLIDTKSKTFTVSVPSDAAPNEAITVSPSGSPSAFSSLYIQGKSKAAITHTASGKYGASISSYAASLNGSSYSGRTATSALLNTSGNLTVTAKATDSRGLSTSKTASIYVYPYFKPYIAPASGQSKIVCARCKEDGTLSDSGTFLKVICKAAFAAVNGNNTTTVKLRYKTSTGSYGGWITLLSTTTPNTDYSGVVNGVVLALTSGYTV